MIDFFSSNRSASPNPQQRKQAPMNPTPNAFSSREPPQPPQPPFRPNPMPNTAAGNPQNFSAPMMPQYVFMIDSFIFVDHFS
jgi:hypothetical protein